MKLLALCGSLRRESRSLALLQAMQLLARDMEFSIQAGLGQLPLFNPDDEGNPPAAVQALWQAAGDADAIVIASPEYAHGVTGVIKNTVDWLVGHVPFAYKPVALLNPSHRAVHADESLREILSTMSAQLIPGACERIPVTACGLDAARLAADDQYAESMRQVLAAVRAFCETRRASPALD